MLGAARTPVFIALLVVCSAVVQLCVAAAAGSYFTADSHSYMKPAFQLAEHGRFFGDDLLLFSDIVAFPSVPKTAPDTLRTPGYPLFLAVLYLAGAPVGIVIAVQSAIHVLVGTLCFFVVRRWTRSTTTAAGAAILAIFFPPSVVAATRIMSENLAEAAVFAAFALTIEGIRRRSLAWSVAAGAVLSFVPLVRPIGIGLPAAFGIALLLARAPRRLIATLLATALVLPAIWVARNLRVSGVATVSSAGAENLLIAAAGALAIRDAPTLHQVFALQRLSGFYRPLQRERETLVRLALGEMESDRLNPHTTLHAVRAKYYRRVALRAVAENPAAFAAVMLSSAIELTFGTVRELSQRAGLAWRPAILASIPLTLVLIALLVSGFRSLRVAHPDVALLSAATIVYFLLASAVPVVEARFTVPFAPVAAILVSSGLQKARSVLFRDPANGGQ